jgi:hypothetical protein
LFPDTCNVDAGPPLLLEALVLVDVLPELLVVPLEELAVPPPPVLDEPDADELLPVVLDPPLAPVPVLDEPEAPAPLVPVLVAELPPHADTIARQEKARTGAVRTETSRMASQYARTPSTLVEKSRSRCGRTTANRPAPQRWAVAQVCVEPPRA